MVSTTSEARPKKKLNWLWAWVLVSVKLVLFTYRYAWTKDAHIDYSSGEVIPLEPRPRKRKSQD